MLSAARRDDCRIGTVVFGFCPLFGVVAKFYAVGRVVAVPSGVDGGGNAFGAGAIFVFSGGVFAFDDFVCAP